MGQVPAVAEPVSIEGELVSIPAHHVTIRRTDPQLGEIDVHFPRLGYMLTSV